MYQGGGRLKRKPAKGDLSLKPTKNPVGALLTATEACAYLGVKPQTLYAYVSRGWLQTEPGTPRRARLYARPDLEALKERQRARGGYRAAAATALRWGEPVLDTAISKIGAEGTVAY